MRVINRLLYAAMAIPFISAIAAMFILPSRIPAHINTNGTIDRYGSKFELFIIPAFVIIFGLFMRVFINLTYRSSQLRLVIKYCIGAIYIAAVLVFGYMEISWIIKSAVL